MLLFRILAFTGACFFGKVLPGQTPVGIEHDFRKCLLVPSVLRDASTRLNLDSIRNLYLQGRFAPASSPYFTVGSDPSNWWLHIQVLNHLPVDRTLWLRLNRKNFDEFRLYNQRPDGRIDSLGKVGAQFQQDARFSLMNGYYFPVTFPPGQNQLWCVASNRIGSMHLGLSLHTPEDFALTNRQHVWFFGLFCGVTLLALFFGFLLLVQYRDWVYLFFILYILNVLLREAYNYSADFGIMPVFQRNATSMLIGATFGLFYRQFLRLWEQGFRLDRVVKLYVGVIVLLAIAVWQLANLGRGDILKNMFWIIDTVNLIFAFLALVIMLTFFRTSVRARILTIAYFPLAVAFIIILLRNLNLIPNYPFINQLVMAGFILEVAVLTVGFVYWNRYLESERRLLEMKLAIEQQEKQLAVQAAEQRVKDRIARDLHDDLSASISSIRILSEVAHRYIVKQAPEAASVLEKISQSANAVVESIGDLIWAVKPHPDFLNDIADRMREYAGRVLDARDIDYQMKIPRVLPMVDISLEVRRNFYLIFKEAVNNAVKYSGCRRMAIDLRLTGGNALTLTISDDGAGFDPSGVFTGNGLLNMKRRAADIGAQIRIASETGVGTTVFLAVELETGE